MRTPGTPQHYLPNAVRHLDRSIRRRQACTDGCPLWSAQGSHILRDRTGDIDPLVCPVWIMSKTPDGAASPRISVLTASERGRSRCGACSATRRGEATGVGSPGCVPRRSNRSAPSARPSGHILHPRVLEPSIRQSTPACSCPRTGRPSVMGGADTGSAIVRYVPIQADVSARGMAIVLLPRCRAAARRGADPRVGSRELRLARCAQQRRN